MTLINKASIMGLILAVSAIRGGTPPAIHQWYGVSSLALAGGGLFYSGEDDRINPAGTAFKSREFESSVLNYPADIQALRASWYPGNTVGLSALTFRYMDYGRFTSRDEDGEPTGLFTASDTWIHAATAGLSPSGHSAWGLSAGVLSSSIGTNRYDAVLFTGSVMVRLDSARIKVGVAIQNLGWIQQSSTRERLPGQVEITLSRTLAHLPLDIYLDGRWENGHVQGGLGGVFQLNSNLQFLIGTSTNRLDQSLGEGKIHDIFADTGMGLILKRKTLRISLGSYLYGPGGWAQGIGIQWGVK